MRKCKESMTPGYRKCGYLKVGRNVLKAFFSGDGEQSRLAAVWLCVQTFAYFSEGVVCLNDFSYVCRPGEWVTSFTEIAGLTGLCRKSVKRCLERLEKNLFLQVKDLDSYKLIVLMNYEQQVVIKRDTVNNPTDLPPAGTEGGDGFFDAINNFYTHQNGQKGAVN